MKTIRLAQIGLLTALAMGGAAVQFTRNGSEGVSSFELEAAYPPTLYERVQATCGACHNNDHFTTASDFKLNNGANAKAGGIVAQTRGILTTDMTGGDPDTSLIVQKPLAGSITPHGGIKLASNHPTIVALRDWVNAGAPAVDMDPPAAVAPTYRVGVPGGQHEILYVRKTHRPGGFRDMIASSTGSAIMLTRFDAANAIQPGFPIDLTAAAGIDPNTNDVQHPSVSLDGTKVVFSRRQNGGRWKIWRMDIDGSNLTQITTGSGDDLQPFFLPWDPQYANDPQAAEPARSGEGGIGFVSNRAGFRDEYEASLTTSLYLCDATGGNLRQVDFNPSHDVHPMLHSSGVTLMTRWEHNEHQGHNFMPLFAICTSDWRIGGTNLFGAFGEHGTGTRNSLHRAMEDWTYSAMSPNGVVEKGWVVAINSSRDAAAGSIVGPLYPKLTTPAVAVNIIAQGDDDEMRGEMDGLPVLSSITYRSVAPLLNNRYVVAVSTLVSITEEFNEFNGSTTTTPVYGDFRLMTFELNGTQDAINWATLIDYDATPGVSYDDVTPVLVRQTPKRVGKPIDRTINTGLFTSGNVTNRQSDGQPTNVVVSELKSVRFLRALQFSQGSVDTGRDTDEGIATQVLGEAPIFADGSFAVNVPAEVPIQFQLIDKNNNVKVSHKPWVQVMRGETMRCVGCHADHSAPALVQTLEARQVNATTLASAGVKQYNFKKDIQPIFNEKCVRCHDYALSGGAAGNLSLVGRPVPGGETESYQELIGKGLVMTQRPNNSPFMWRMTGKRLDLTPQSDYPADGDALMHKDRLTAAELATISGWIGTGINFRVVDDGDVSTLANLDQNVFTNTVWPILEARCLVCHTTGGAGGLAMNLDGIGNREAESENEVMENRLEAVARRVNFMVPQASYILRKPLGQSLGGMSHVGGQLFTGFDDPQYVAIHSWIAAANPALAPGVPETALAHVENHPNPFRDSTMFVYQLQGSAAATVTLRIYSQGGKMIRELQGPGDVGSTTMGWNKVEWDGRDKNGKVVGNDVYFYAIDAKFNDGVKKTIRGKCVKVK